MVSVTIFYCVPEGITGGIVHTLSSGGALTYNDAQIVTQIDA